MAKYRRRPPTVEAVQFDPTAHPWPKCVVPWERVGLSPRDMSWGFIDARRGKIHVHADDWIVDECDDWWVYSPAEFDAAFEDVE